MKRLYFFIALLLFIVVLNACKGPATNEKADTLKNVKDTINKISTTDTSAINNNDEYIEWDKVRINGKLPTITTAKLLYATLGKPDSIVTPNMHEVCVSFYDKPFKWVYFKGSNFELYGDTVVISTLNFRQPGLVFTAGKLVLDGNTTLKDLAKVFPKSAKDQSTMSLGDNEMVISISINTGKKPSDDGWVLMFKNGKLIQIDYWMPC
jgi:hypothetical protein